MKILLLEDELYTRKFLKKLLLENSLVSKVYDTSSCREALDIVKKHKPNIAMLDIELGANESVNGLGIAKIISKILPSIYFVFVTGYGKYAIDSFAVHPFDYILKPIKKEKILETVNGIVSKIEEEGPKIAVQCKDEVVFIPLREIIYLETDERNILLHTRHNIYTVSDNLTSWEEKLGGDFLRVHQSFLVNKNKISKITNLGNRSFEIEFLSFSRKALMSRYKYEELKDKLKV